MKLKRIYLVISALLLMSMFLLACGGGSNTASQSGSGSNSGSSGGTESNETSTNLPPADLEIASILTPGGQALPLLVAEEKGFFAEQNLNVTVTLMSGTSATTAINSGSVPVGIIDSGAGLISFDKGAPVKMVADIVIQAPYDLVASPQYGTIADLKGTLIATTAPSNIITVFTDRLLRDGGLNREDYDFVFSGGNNERFAAIKSGGASAGLLTAPGNFLAEDEGFVKLGNTVDSFPKISFDSVWVNENWSKDNEDVLVRWLKAMIKSLDWIYDSNNKEESIEMLLKEDPNTTRELAEKAYNLNVVEYNIFTRDGDFDKEAMDVVLEINSDLENFASADIPKQEDFFDGKYIKRAKEELGK